MMKIIFQNTLTHAQFLASGAGILEDSPSGLGGEAGGGNPLQHRDSPGSALQAWHTQSQGKK